MKSIVTILGDATHSHDLLLSRLQAILRENMSEYELVDIKESGLSAALAEQPDIVVLSKMNWVLANDGSSVPWMTEAIERKIIRYVEQGGSWLVWHSGLASYSKEGKYVKMLGGYFYHRPPDFLQVKYSTVANMPMTISAIEVEALDEHYMVSCDKEKANIFLNSSSAEGDSPAGWYRQVGKGKICCITAPHPSEDINIPELVEILYKCMKWCSEKDQ